MIPVAANDDAFSIHAVLLTAVSLFQIAIYDVSATFPYFSSCHELIIILTKSNNFLFFYFHAAWKSKSI